MTNPDAAGTEAEEIKDFTIRRPPIRFRIDDDVFVAPPLIGGFMLRKLGNLHAQLGDATAQVATDPDAMQRVIEVMAESFKTLMPGEPGMRFAARLLSDGDPAGLAPIGLMDQALPALYYLLERYGLRPTQPSSPSPTGSMDGTPAIPSVGTSSTAGASLEASPTAA